MQIEAIMNSDAIDNTPVKIVLADGESFLSLREVKWLVGSGFKRSDELDTGDLIEYTTRDGDVSDSAVDDVVFNVPVSDDDLVLVDQTATSASYLKFCDLIVEEVEELDDARHDAEQPTPVEVFDAASSTAEPRGEAQPATVSALFGALQIPRPTEAELHAIAARLIDGKSTLHETFLAALMTEHIDDVVRCVRNRDSVQSLLSHLAFLTRWLTTVASRLSIDVDSQPVVPSPDFHEWRESKLGRLLSMLAAEMDRLASMGSRNDRQLLELAEMRGRLQDATAHVEKLRAASADAASRHEAVLSETRLRTLAANAALTRYRDLPEVVVARVDPVTRLARRYLVVDGDSLRTTSDWSRATRFSDAGSARTARSAAIRALRRQGRDYAYASEAYAVLSISLHETTSEEE